ncbi:MAG: thioesterase [Deltaproteobacteria bacterium]|nr:thioesterase [Deltaproteobacteria bacterium]MBU54138.1 thioesterase [Deltaproteobacteria bacterium]|tara:strand:+ start:448 stop:867 length:420 start_codon:yes stop_codon:yes gene_type:complete
MKPVMQKEEIESFLGKVFPQMNISYAITSLSSGAAEVELYTEDKHLRPGGTISGPTLFSLADLAFYVVTLAHIGPEALTVTTNVNINFMRKPRPGTLRAQARILKLGRSLCVGDVLIFSEGTEGAVAHANVTYALPPQT